MVQDILSDHYETRSPRLVPSCPTYPCSGLADFRISDRDSGGFTFWSQVGGQYHLDLMYWPWKPGLVWLRGGLIVAITGRWPGSRGGSLLSANV